MTQQKTTSLCPICFREIPAVANPFDDMVPMLYKVCPEHGMSRGVIEKDRQFYQKFNTYTRRNRYPIGIINITDRCNADCKYCFYPCGLDEMPIEALENIIEASHKMLCGFILSGGEPTCHSQYFEIIKRMTDVGIDHSMLTNGVLLNDDSFFNEAVTCGIVDREHRVRAQLSIHGPDQQGEEVYQEQIHFLEKCRSRGLKVHMVMVNLAYGPEGHTIMDEVEKTVAFMQRWRDVVPNWRVRTVCNVWNAQNVNNRGYNSDLYKHFKYRALHDGKEFKESDLGDVNNIYAIATTYDGMNLALMAAPSLDSIDIGYLNRGPFMLANDRQWYSVPHALLINEGIDKGFYRGNKLEDLPANN